MCRFYPLLNKFVGIMSRIFPSGSGVRSAWRDRLMIGFIGLVIKLESCKQCQKNMPTAVSHVTTQEESTW